MNGPWPEHHGVHFHALDQKSDVDVVLGGMFARHVSNMKIPLLVDVGDVKSGAFKGGDKFFSGLLWKGFGIEAIPRWRWDHRDFGAPV